MMTELARSSEHFTKLNGGSLNDSRVISFENQAIDPSDQALRIQISGRGSLQQSAEMELKDIQVLNVDAAAFVSQAPGRYDVVIIDFPDPNSVELAKLYSQHFYGFLKQKMSADGIFVQQSTSPYHAKETFLCIGRTITSAGLSAVPFHDNVPSFGEWGWWIGGPDQIYQASSLREKLSSIPDLTAETRYLTPEIIRASLHFGKTQLETNQTEISTIANPRIYNYYLDAWKHTRGIL